MVPLSSSCFFYDVFFASPASPPSLYLAKWCFFFFAFCPRKGANPHTEPRKVGDTRVGAQKSEKSGASHEGGKSSEGWSRGGSGQKGEAQKGGSQQIPVFLFLVTSNSTPFHRLGPSKTTFGASWSSCETPRGPRGPDRRRPRLAMKDHTCLLDHHQRSY